MEAPFEQGTLPDPFIITVAQFYSFVTRLGSQGIRRAKRAEIFLGVFRDPRENLQNPQILSGAESVGGGLS